MEFQGRVCDVEQPTPKCRSNRRDERWRHRRRLLQKQTTQIGAWGII